MDAQTIGIILTGIVAWSALLVGVIKLLLIRVSQDIDTRLDAISATQQAEAKEWLRVERELMSLREHLPREYQRKEDSQKEVAVLLARIDSVGGHINDLVRRNDHIRSETLLHAKIDGLAKNLLQMLRETRYEKR